MKPMEYTVKITNDCKIIFGDIPLSDMAFLINSMPGKSVVDAKAASLVGAEFIVGAPEDIKKFIGSVALLSKT